MRSEELMRRVVLVGMFAAALASTACGPHANQVPPPNERSVAWRRLGSWSGRGSLQTESFTSDTGTLRVRWDTTSAAGSGTAPAIAGNFRLEAHSAISGRLLQEVVDHAGAGGGVGYVQQDPHVFYIVVESAQLNWQFTVEEAVGYP
jgi:hypothetical protein